MTTMTKAEDLQKLVSILGDAETRELIAIVIQFVALGFAWHFAQMVLRNPRQSSSPDRLLKKMNDDELWLTQAQELVSREIAPTTGELQRLLFEAARQQQYLNRELHGYTTWLFNQQSYRSSYTQAVMDRSASIAGVLTAFSLLLQLSGIWLL